MASSTKQIKVSVNLSDVDCNESFPDRILSLSAPAFHITIGRGSLNDENIEPAPENAWFSSRVMSRQHAILRAHPDTQLLTIEDDASMHGTFLNGDKVGREPVSVITGDILKFGTEVVRGDEIYQPLKLVINYDWEDLEHPLAMTPSMPNHVAKSFPNKFTVDFSEEDFSSDFDDEEVQILHASQRQPSVEILYQVNTAESYALPPTQPGSQPTPALPLTAVATKVPAETTTDLTSPPVLNRAPPAATQGEDSDMDDNSEALQSPYYSEDEEESDMDSDIFEDEGDFADEVGKEPLNADTSKVNSVLQPVQVPTSNVPIVPTDNVEREPSPSDAALAKPRLGAFTTSPISKPPWISVPPPPATLPMSRPYHGPPPTNRYGMYYSNFDDQNSARPSHSFVDPYPYNSLSSSVCSVGTFNPYSSLSTASPWETWKATPTCPGAQPPRPMTRLGSSTYQISRPLVPSNVSTFTGKQRSKEILMKDAVDNSRGKKRKADSIADSSDDDSVDSISDHTLTKRVVFPSSSSIVTHSSPATEVSYSAVEADMIVYAKEMEDLAEGQECVANRRLKEHLGDAEITVETITSQDDVDETVIESLAQEPSPKRLKTNNGGSVASTSRVTTALRYTATALAGATFGVLGTVVGLASLPADYFV